MSDLMAKFLHDHALDVSEPAARIICERIHQGLLEVSGTEMHGEISFIIYTTLRAYFVTYEFELPEPSAN